MTKCDLGGEDLAGIKCISVLFDNLVCAKYVLDPLGSILGLLLGKLPQSLLWCCY